MNNPFLANTGPRAAYTEAADLVISHSGNKNHQVLRTCSTPYAIWKSKYGKAASPFTALLNGKAKEAAIIDGEVWLFSTKAVKAGDLVSAIKIALNYFNASAEEFVQDVYIKHLDSTDQNAMHRQAEIIESRKYYQSVSLAVMDAAQQLGNSNELHFWVFATGGSRNNSSLAYQSLDARQLGSNLQSQWQLTALSV